MPRVAAPRDRWATKIGLVFALAGNAIGLGNFLRFPVQAVRNGGGAFMIPYLLALVLIGIPLMWVECAIGRKGGAQGHGHTAGMLTTLWHHPLARAIGVFGIFIPFCVSLYYIYITSWTLAFAFFSLTGRYFGLASRAEMGDFVKGFQGVVTTDYFSGIGTAYFFNCVTLLFTLFILAGGIAKGIERLAKVAIPLLFVLGIGLAVRVLTFGTPDPGRPDWNVAAGLGYVWNPRFDRLSDASIWLAAAGQIFFTLSVGWGIIHTYTSYLCQDDDVALTGLATASLNEFAEVVLGGTIAIPAAVAFFGLAGTQEIANGGAFDLGFQSLPLVFQRIPLGHIVGAAWFLLLFLAGITSAVAIVQPAVALLQEGWGIPRGRAVSLVGIAVFLLGQPVIFFNGHGFLDELDFWVGAFALVLFGFLEVMIFSWVYGAEKGWADIVRGAAITPPRIFVTVVKYLTPTFLGVVLFAWAYQEVPAKLRMEGVAPADMPYVIAARLMLVALFLGMTWLAFRAARAQGR